MAAVLAVPSFANEKEEFFESKVRLAVERGWTEADLGTALVGLAESFVGDEKSLAKDKELAP